MKRAIALAVLLSAAASMLSACIVVPAYGGGYGGHRYHDRY